MTGGGGGMREDPNLTLSLQLQAPRTFEESDGPSTPEGTEGRGGGGGSSPMRRPLVKHYLGEWDSWRP